MAINYGNKKITKNLVKTPKKAHPGNIEDESRKEVQEVKDFIRKAKDEKQKFKDNTDANYFTVITFNNSKQLDEFFNKLGITPSDKQYVDGKQLAKKLEGLKLRRQIEQRQVRFE